ncbi:phosphoribosylanthranilate isomerase [Kaistella sp.]|uniref:phosphoribosylanthranilate isomerase n=1 Tax=Kaistella sp. TaxID=2782235 RepID=UPI002F92D36D
MKLKVCGLTKREQILELISMNVDYLGFIFYEKSPRFVLNGLMMKDIESFKHNGKVGVFVNEKIEKVAEISWQANLNYIQLHGDEDEIYIDELKTQLNPEIKIIKVFRIGNNVENLKFKIQNLKSDVDYFLFDTDSKAFGGTGKAFNWQILNELEIPKPYFLSGGISPINFNDIQNIRQPPFALDINSKFETEAGNKDLEKIKNFYEKL